MTGAFELATRAAVLFFTNLVAMVLAGALTFIAVGVSPVSARSHSAAFIRSKLWLFFILVMAVSVPLYFYSEKILFNADYRAAKSVPLQEWLHDNDLTLTDVDISIKNRTLFLGLEGPNPPVNIKNLYDRLASDTEINDDEVPFKIIYTWTQRVDGAWPSTSSTIDDVVVSEQAHSSQLFAHGWAWSLTQYDAERGSRPQKPNDYIVRFDDHGKVSATASCGTVKGKFTLRGKSIVVKMRSFNWFKCRKEPAFELFLGDLERGDAFYVENDQLRITLTTESGIMYFDKYGE